MGTRHGVWDGLAAKYDGLWVQKYSLGPTRDAVGRILSARLGGRAFSLLDLGCGTGQLLRELRDARPDCHLLGADKSPEMVRHANARLGGDMVRCLDADCGALGDLAPAGSLDAVVCCHSFPYYRNKAAVLDAVHGLLCVGGIAVFVQASVNNPYDGLILRAVEATAERADYLSRAAFRALAEVRFALTEEFAVRARWYMPSICGFVLEKRP